MAEDHDRTLALLGVAATKKMQDEPCPSDNAMSAFIENRVNSETREMILSHINRCEDCYFVWEQVGVYAKQDSEQAVKQHEAEKIGVVQHVESWFKAGFFWQTAATGLALATLAIVFVVNQPDMPYQNSETNSSMVAVELEADVLAKSINQFSDPWENQTFGFTKSTYATSVKAVGAGIWNAKSKMKNLKIPLPAQLVSEPAIEWQNSEWHNYYAFGEWILNAWILAKAERTKLSQWIQLKQPLQILETGFKQRQQHDPEAKIVLQTIDKMKISLNILSKKEDFSARNILLREIELGLQKLFQ